MNSNQAIILLLGWLFGSIALLNFIQQSVMLHVLTCLLNMREREGR